MIGLKDQCFGVEVEMTSITRKQTTQAPADYFGTISKAKGGAYDTWKVKNPTGKEWKLVSDASIIRGQWTRTGYLESDIKDFRVELVIPKLAYPELPKLQEYMRCLKQIGAKVSDSCGIHVHVGTANHNRQSLKNLISIMCSKGNLLSKALQVNEVRVIRFCKKVREPTLRKARALSAEETSGLIQLERIWYGGDVHKTDHYNRARYYALSLHSVLYQGTVEQRCFNSTLNPNLATAYVNLCLAMSAQVVAQRSTITRKTHSDNELFTFRVWLVRLGLNGDEFRETRDLLLTHLDGDRAWRFGKDSYEVNRNKKKKHREVGR